MEENSTPRYIKIATDIASKIANNIYKEGTVLKGRTVLASFYNVSPETVRKAINILEKHKIVELKRGVGIIVRSILHAREFEISNQKETIASLKYNQLEDLFKKKAQIDLEIENKLKDFYESIRYQSKEKLNLAEINIPTNSWIIGKSIQETNFYNYTEATIVAINKKDGNIINSPGPNYIFEQDDRLIFNCKDDKTFDRVTYYLVYSNN